MWNFSYDGDGTRVAQAYTPYDESGNPQMPVFTEYFMGGAYEVSSDQVPGVRKYYAIAGMTVALDDGSGLQYLLTDHLGSIVAVTDASGTLTSQQRYLPFGEVRSDVGSIAETDLAYTGQRAVDGLGLLDYKARFYDQAIGRFVQPDSIIPGGGPQSLNRYSYTLNNPIRYSDPSGHRVCESVGDLCLSENQVTNLWNTPSGRDLLLHRNRDRSEDSPITKKKNDGDVLLPVVPPGLACGPVACVQPSPSNVCPIGETCIIKPGAALYPAKLAFSWNAVDWTDIGINLIGIAGDLILASSLAGDVAGPELWYLTETAEYAGTMRSISHGDAYGITTAATSRTFNVLAELHDAPDLIPGIGALFNVANIFMDFSNAFVLRADTRSP